jgi:hypothetical protein
MRDDETPLLHDAGMHGFGCKCDAAADGGDAADVTTGLRCEILLRNGNMFKS